MPNEDDSLTALVNEFAALWKAGANPELGPFLERVPEEQQAAAGRLLIAVMVESRHATISVPEAKIGTMIGPYKLQQRLGEGGMGDVWRAEQEQPVRRIVALKLIKEGLRSTEVLGRFEAERQALAMMDHQNIAKVFDAGSTLAGRPYFVMELVNGVPITRYCDENQLSIDQRLRLFMDVCAGVQHAHQKGIIHRDLKPANILVGLQDGQPVPKVIDFGLAKAVESTSRLTDQSLFTGIGQILGTLKYMSPEQASLDNLDIDTRTDIYALGVILYELLTGSTPLDETTLKGQAALKLLEMVREKEPIKPSSRLGSSSEQEISAITNKRRTDSGRLNRILAGDLDWIVMKSLEKDRARRYDSASGFAADVQRYLQSEPVIARPPSLNYRMRKFVRKHRVGVASVALFALALIGGIVGTSWALSRARQAEQDANAAWEAESTQRQKAEMSQQLAEKSLAFARKGNEILGSVFADLDPNAVYREVSDLRNALGGNLEDAVKELDDSAISDPVALGDMLETLGLSLMGLGLSQQATELFERLLKLRTEQFGTNHVETLDSINLLATSHYQTGRHDQALPLYEQTLELRKNMLGADHPDTIQSVNNLASCYQLMGRLEKSLPLMEQAAELMKIKLGPEHEDTLKSMNNLAAAYRAAGKFDQAFPLFEETLDKAKASLGPSHPLSLVFAGNLAVSFQNAGQLTKALPLHEEVLELKKAQLGADHPETLSSMNSLASCYRAAGQIDKAMPLFQQTLEMRKTRLGPDHPATLTTMSNLAVAYLAVGRAQEALPLCIQSLELRKAKLGEDHPDTLLGMNSLASCYEALQQLDKALPLYELTWEKKKTKLGPDHPDTLISMNNLALAYRNASQMDKAMPMFEQSLELSKVKLGVDHPGTLLSMNNLASAYQAVGKLELAMPLYEQTLELRKAKLGPDHPDTLMSMNNIAAGYREAGDLGQAITLYEQALEGLTKKLGPDHPNVLLLMANVLAAYAIAGESAKYDQLFPLALEKWRKLYPSNGVQIAGVLARSGQCCLEMKRPSEAEVLLRESLSIAQAIRPDNWSTFHTQSMLGGSLLGMHGGSNDATAKAKLLEEAEPLLVAGYEGLKQREASIPVADAKRIAEALERVIEFYTLVEKAIEVEKYRALRSAGPSGSER